MSSCVDTKKAASIPPLRTVTSEVGRVSERLAPTQNKQSCHVPTIELATKDVSLAVTHNAALIKTEQAEFTQKIKNKELPFVLAQRWNPAKINNSTSKLCKVELREQSGKERLV